MILKNFEKINCLNRSFFLVQESRYNLKKTIICTCMKHISITVKTNIIQNYFKDLLLIGIWFFLPISLLKTKNSISDQNTTRLLKHSHNYSSFLSSFENLSLSPFPLHIYEKTFSSIDNNIKNTIIYRYITNFFIIPFTPKLQSKSSNSHNFSTKSKITNSIILAKIKLFKKQQKAQQFSETIVFLLKSFSFTNHHKTITVFPILLIYFCIFIDYQNKTYEEFILIFRFAWI